MPRYDPITQLIYGFLLWNAPRRSADAALTRVGQEMVDNNDLRVSHDQEIIALIGESYPLVEERSARLREALNDIFARQHILCLDGLLNKPKREARQFLESLSGITSFVSSHVTLTVFEGHAVPVDDRLADVLRREKVVDAEATIPDITSFLERRIRAEHSLQAHATFQAWVDVRTRRASRGNSARSGSKAETAPRKKTKKSVGRK